MFSCASTHPTRSSIPKTIINIFIFIHTRGTYNTFSTKTTSSIFIFICTRGTSTTTTTKTTSSTRTICSTRTTISIFIFICICSTSTSSISFVISLITKLLYTVSCSQKVYIMSCPFAFYSSLISPYSCVIKILRRFSMLLSANLVEKVKIISFKTIFD